jgi:small membrane protein
MLIQYLLIAGVVLLFGFFLRRHGTTSASASVKIGFVLFLVFGVLAVLYPDALSVVARWLGVGRGTDLLLYGLLVAFAFAVLDTLLRFRNLERRYVLLARTIALRDSQRGTATAWRAQRGTRTAAKQRNPEG